MATIYDMVVVAHGEASADAQKDLLAETGYWMLAGLKLKDYFKKIVSGMHSATVQTKVNLAKATGTITFASFVEDDTVTINGIGFTGKDTPAAGTEFETGVSAASTAASLVTKANANTTLDGMVIATSSTSVVTLTALIPGELGNAVTLAISAHGSVSAARMSGGTNGDVERTHYYGSSSY